jgi:ArsR family transcriptional regulator, lead/cadmium/zinc/bismuth-responsive transcriptional repressor
MYNQVFNLQEHFFKSLAHAKRLEIINLLRDQELPVTDIHSMLDLPQANISQHLMILRDANIVKTRKKGKQVLYSLSDKKIIKAIDLIREVLDEPNTEIKNVFPLVHDPICKMRVSSKTAGFEFKHKDQQFYFCASGCLKKFKKNPDKYVSK